MTWVKVNHPPILSDKLPPEGKRVLILVEGDAAIGWLRIDRGPQPTAFWTVPGEYRPVRAWADCIPEIPRELRPRN